MVVASPLNLKKVTTSANDSQKKVTEARSSVKNVGQVILKRTKVKREAFAQTNLFRKRREENEKRMMLEDELEAPTVVRRPGGPQQLTQATGVRGFFDRILGFIGYLSAGWLMNNLPTWIAMGKEFVARIQKAGQILSGFFNNTVRLFFNVANVLGALGQNLLQFDFFDTSNRVKVAMGDLNFRMENLTSQIEEAYGLLTTPLTEGKYSGEKIPETGTPQTNEGAYAETSTPENLGPATNLISGARAFVQVGFPEKGAAYLAGNAQQESGWRGQRDPWTLNDGAGTNKGIMSWNRGRIIRAEKYLGKPLNTASNSDQVRWVKQEMKQSYPDAYKIFMNPNASDVDLQRASYIYLGYGDVGSRFAYANKAYAALQKGGPTLQPQSSKSGSQPTVVSAGSAQYTKGNWETGSGFNPAGAKDVYGRPIVLSRTAAEAFAAMMKDSGGKVKGSDVASSQRSPAKNERVGGATQSRHLKGLALDIHGSSNSWIRKFGSRYGWVANDYSGSHGGHFEFRGGSTSNVSAPTPAQMSAPQQQTNMVPLSLTQERKGQDIMIIEPQQQQNIITPASGGGDMSPSPISDFQLLNNFIKNKLLLDLAYV